MSWHVASRTASIKCCSVERTRRHQHIEKAVKLTSAKTWRNLEGRTKRLEALISVVRLQAGLRVSAKSR